MLPLIIINLSFLHVLQAIIVSQAKTAPHCQLRASEETAFKKKATKAGVTVVTVPGSCDACCDPTGFIVVRNDVSALEIEEIKWIDVMLEVRNRGSHDSRRNNYKRDFGHCGFRNSNKKASTMGLSCPEMFIGSTAPWVKDIFKQMSQLVGVLNAHHGLKMCDNEHRNAMFAHKTHEDSCIEALSATLHETAHPDKDEKGLLGVHIDSQNCSVYTHVLSRIHHYTDIRSGKVGRVALHTHGKEAVGTVHRRCVAMEPMVANVMRICQSGLISPSVQTINSSYLSNQQPGVTDSPHFDKMTMYYNALGASIETFIRFAQPRQPLRCAAGLIKVAMHHSHKVQRFVDWMGVLTREAKNGRFGEWLDLPCNLPSHWLNNSIDSMVDKFTFAVSATFPSMMSRIALSPNEPSALTRSNSLGVLRVQPSTGSVTNTLAQHVSSVNTLIVVVKESKLKHDSDPNRFWEHKFDHIDSVVTHLCGSHSSETDGLPGFAGAGELLSQLVMGVSVHLGILPVALTTHNRLTWDAWCKWERLCPALSELSQATCRDDVVMAVSCAMNLENSSIAEEALCQCLPHLLSARHTSTKRDFVPAGLLNVWIDCTERCLMTGRTPNDGHVLSPLMNVPDGRQFVSRGELSTVIDRERPCFWDATSGRTKKSNKSSSRIKPLKSFFPKSLFDTRLAMPVAVSEAILPFDFARPLNISMFCPVPVVKQMLNTANSQDCQVFRQMMIRKNGTAYYAMGIIMPGDAQTVVFPNPNFPLCETRRMPLVNGSHRPEALDDTCIVSGLRYFQNRHKAKQHSALQHTFNNPGQSALVNQTRLLLMLPTTQTCHNEVQQFVVSFSAFTKGKNKRNRATQNLNKTFLVGILFSTGGRAYHLVDQAGNRTSEQLLLPPLTTVVEPVTGRKKTLLGVVSHVPMQKSNPRYINSSANFEMAFSDGTIEDISVSDSLRLAPIESHEYVLLNNLSSVSPYKQVVSSCKRRCDGHLSAFPPICIPLADKA